MNADPVSARGEEAPEHRRNELYGILCCGIVRDPVFARRRPSGPSIVSACHDGTRLAHTGELRLSETLGMVDGREPNAMTAIRARVPDGWTTFRGDEEGF